MNLQTLHRFIAALFAIILVVGLYTSNLFNANYQKGSLYKSAELRFHSINGVRTSDFAIKKPDHSFLVAQKVPKELNLAIEFAHAGSYLVVVSAEYPQWLCQNDELNKAYVDLRGGSANDRIPLVRGSSSKLYFSIAKEQRLKALVTNNANPQCGRAVLTFYQDNHRAAFLIAVFAFWVLIYLVCLMLRVSPYIAALGVFVNVILFLADASLGELSTQNLLVNTGFGVIVVSGLLAFSSLPSWKIFRFTMLLLVVGIFLVPLSFIAYYYVFSAPMSIEAIHGLMQSYDSQMIEFWQQFVGKKRTLLLIIIFVGLYFLVSDISRTKGNRIRVLLSSGVLFFAGLSATAGQVGNSSMTNLLIRSVIEYKWEIRAFRKIADQRKTISTAAKREPKHSNDTTVIVFGESVNKKFMSAYGYVQATTPSLDRRVQGKEAILYKNAYSNHSHSNPTMSHILTSANQYNGQSWLESPSIFNYASSSSTQTHWLTNHRLLGGWSNHITTIASEADRIDTINFKIGYGSLSSNYDGDLIPMFKDSIAARPNQLTFLHLYNSHLNYCNRYPKSSKQFPLELQKSLYGRIGEIRRISEGLLACYVNSIYYTDTVLEQLFIELDQKDEPSILVYVADHAEELIDERVHNSANFTYDMINIPLVIWANEQWRQTHSAKWRQLLDNQDKVVTNDLMFESVLGIAGITSPTIDLKYDISSKHFVSLDNPLTLHGRVKVNSVENWNYWQNKNSAILGAARVDAIATGIRSLGQAFVAAELGFHVLQISVARLASERDLFLLDENLAPIMSLADFIDRVSNREIKEIVLSLSPDDKITSLELKELLAELNQKYPLKLTHDSLTSVNILPLFAPDFQARLEQEKSERLWIRFKSRYTDPAPVSAH